MDRIHIFLDGVRLFRDVDCCDLPPSEGTVSIRSGRGPVYITTFAVTCSEDIDILQYYFERVVEELRQRFKEI